nr:MAG TPA: hypothetical protein [Caudoviricetes sp.]DAY14084.1 MAG TPA: hypothetical protein [Caudoviricetes sp.]
MLFFKREYGWRIKKDKDLRFKAFMNVYKHPKTD